MATPFMVQLTGIKSFSKNQYYIFKLSLFFVISLLFALLNSRNCFFWDTISQISTPANWYYENNFRYFFVPANVATGHPTFAGMYLALIWKIFGKSLYVSHLAMVPFIFGILVQIDEFLKNTDSGKRLIPLLIFLAVVTDATLVSQMSMVTFDIIHIFFFLYCINSIMKEKYSGLSIAFVLLMLTSLRGSLSGIGIIIYGSLFSWKNNRSVSLKTFAPYIPGLIALAIFLTAFFLQNHWIIHNIVSRSWEESAKFASFSELLRNVGLVIWRLIDFGRLGIWIVFVFIISEAIKRKTLFDDFFENTLLIGLCQFFVFFPIIIIYRNPFGHRFLLPVIIPITVAVTYWILKYSKYSLVVYSIVYALLISGYFWVYPVRISEGWDATPAHWPYYNLRKEMMEYMHLNKIPIENTGSFFPNTASLKLIDLSDENKSFRMADLKTENYILFSNIYNLQDDIIDELFLSGRWKKEKMISKRGVLLVLFSRK